MTAKESAHIVAKILEGAINLYAPVPVKNAAPAVLSALEELLASLFAHRDPSALARDLAAEAAHRSATRTAIDQLLKHEGNR